MLLVPQVLGGPHALNVAIHRVLEQDRTEDAIAAEALARDDARAHLMDLGEHLVVAGVFALLDAVEPQCLGRGATALIEGSDEPVLGFDLVELLFEAHGTR